MAKICYRVPLRSVRDTFVSLKNDIVPDYPERGTRVEGERKQKDREKGEERAWWITMGSMANREMREYQGGQITRETELLCIEPFSPLPTLYAPWYHPPPRLPPSFIPPWLIFSYRSHPHPSNRFKGFLLEVVARF